MASNISSDFIINNYAAVEQQWPSPPPQVLTSTFHDSSITYGHIQAEWYLSFAASGVQELLTGGSSYSPKRWVYVPKVQARHPIAGAGAGYHRNITLIQNINRNFTIKWRMAAGTKVINGSLTLAKPGSGADIWCQYSADGGTTYYNVTASQIIRNGTVISPGQMKFEATVYNSDSAVSNVNAGDWNTFTASVILPESLGDGNVAQVRIAQVYSTGFNKDLWAYDDIRIEHADLYSINIPFSTATNVAQKLHTRSRKTAYKCTTG